MSGKAMLTIVVSRKPRKAPVHAMRTLALCPRSYILGGDYTMTVGITRIADAETIEPKARDGRERLLNGARRLLAEKGYAGMELRDVAEVGRAPRGSIYHHFPGGKRQLAIEAAALEGAEIRVGIERSLRERGLGETLTMFGETFR